MSAEENRAALLRAAERFGDPQMRHRYFDLYSPRIVLHGYAGVEPGIESVRRFYEGFWGAFPDATLTIHETVAEGDLVACRFGVAATHLGDFQGIPPTHRRVSLPGITLLRFEDGRCVERWSQADFLGLLQQLGVMPAPAPGGPSD